MQIILSLIPYVFIVIAFVVVIGIVSKFNKKVVEQRIEQGRLENPLPVLAAQLGLTYEPQAPQQKDNKKLFMNVGGRVHGTYEGVPVEMRFYAYAQHETPELGYTYAYSYTIEKTVTFSVKNQDGRTFEIAPKSSNIVSKPTGNEAFDKVCSYVGDMIVPSSFLSYCGSLGWMSLKLSENALVFNDTFFDQFKGLTAGAKMLAAVHPVWGTTIRNAHIDADKARAFFNRIIELARGAALI